MESEARSGHAQRDLLWGALTAAVAAACYGFSSAAVPGAADGGTLAVASIVAALLLWPFASFAFYAARRWVGLSPAPLVAGMQRIGGSRRRVLPGVAVAWGAGSALVGMLVLLIFVLATPDVSWEGTPLAEVQGSDVLLLNLLVVAEEVVFRLVLLWPIAALLGVRDAPRSRRVGVRAWVAIVVVALLFGWAHAPGNGGIEGMPADVWLLFVLVQKGLVAGVAFGYVGWRWGLEAAALTHFFHNVLLFNLSAMASS